MTDTLEPDVPPQAPPSYEELTAGEAAQSHDVKGDSNVDTKAASADEKADISSGSSTQLPASSSSQLFAPAAGSRIKDPPVDDKEARRIDVETWPGRERRLRTDAVYGLYLETANMYGGPKKMKITDYNGGILFHFSWPLTLPKRFETGHIWLIPGDEAATTPSSPWRFPKLSTTKPTQPDTYAWKYAYNRPSELESIDGRISHVTFNCWDSERQVYVTDCLPMRRDRVEFTVPTARGDAPGRTFVWLCGTIMRNRDAHRWDEGVYVLHEKGDLTKQYGAFKWTEASSLDFRELPDVLKHEHPLLLHTLGHLILCQFRECAKWPPESYEKSGFSKDKTRLAFNVAALQKRASELLESRYVPVAQ